MFVGQAFELGEESGRRNDVATLTLDRLDHDARHFLGRQ